MRKCLTSVLLTILLSSFIVSAWARDEIPDNCEYLYGAHYRPALFPRYEPQNRRLVLVDWTSGTEVSVLGIDLADTLIRGWSADCRYLAVATGSPASWATAVYDTVSPGYIGEVPDAHGIPHPITWGLGGFLMVEGRNGAILWNVPANIQYPLATGFDPITVRNFRRLQWDAESQAVIASLAVGGRAIIDLATGTMTTTARSEPGAITLGGESYTCKPTRIAEGGARIGGLRLLYASDGGVAYLGGGYAANGESVVTLEAGLPSTGLSLRGTSINCRYVAGALGSTEQEDSYDTLIWDVLEGRRVGIFPDARDLPHRLYWDTAERHVLIETRSGAYLWDLQTDTRTLVSSDIVPDATCSSSRGCAWRSFTRVYWDAGREQMLGVPVQSPHSIVGYDVHTGAEVVRYTVPGASEPLDFITSNDSRLLAANADGRIYLWQRDTGALTTFAVGNVAQSLPFNLTSAISTDNHYLAVSVEGELRVWDLNALTDNVQPIVRYSNRYLNPGYLFDSHFFFVNGDTLEASNYDSRRLNVVTGEVFGAPVVLDLDQQQMQAYQALAGMNGRGQPANASQPQCPTALRYQSDTRQIIAKDTATNREWVIEADVNPVYLLLLSPDCRIVYAGVSTRNTTLPYEEPPPELENGFRLRYQFIFWDVATGERLATQGYYHHSKSGYSAVSWSPDGSRGFILAEEGYFLIDNVARTVVPVRFQDTADGYLPTGLYTYWDYSRGLVLIAGFGEVFAIDMITGSERLRFPARDDHRGGCYIESMSGRRGCPYSVSEDGAWVFVYGDSTMSAWNLNTLQHAVIPQEGSGGALISPDGRYLVISRSAVRVWDLANLPAELSERQPIATYGVGANAVLSIRFIDNTTLEVVTRAADGTATTLYDAPTGSIR
ncbi:MAG: WD40 repeat domain-containing protein [Chloroflexi bacterium]|nr:WD40 repeat domain-containing protein [Chloroflexota bacterium]